ncbi:MAG TPA: DNA recombination/repair protein RecA, partial [Sulfurospirillum sp. UBA11407]
GRENVKAFLKENPEVALEIENRIKEALGGKLEVEIE